MKSNDKLWLRPHKDTQKDRKTESKLKNVIVIQKQHTQFTLQRKKPEFKSNINKWNNKTIEIGCFDIEKTCAYWELLKREEITDRERVRKKEKRKDYLKWSDKNMLTLTFDSKIKKRSLIQLCVVHTVLYGSGSKNRKHMTPQTQWSP